MLDFFKEVLHEPIVIRPAAARTSARTGSRCGRATSTFYKTLGADEVNDITWQRLHDPAEPMVLLGAYVDGKLVGIVHYLFHRSCWTIGDYCYLQDLFVAQDARGLGLGRALIEAVEKAAQEAGASRVHWLTQESNATARVLYDKLATGRASSSIVTVR